MRSLLQSDFSPGRMRAFRPRTEALTGELPDELLMELRDLVDDLAPGTVVHLIASDPAAPIDLPAWCHLTGHSYLGPLPIPSSPAPSPPAYALRVQATVRATHPDGPWPSIDD
ncbi:hypothetical protein [Streptosporangium sp. NPDC023615]|uniref:sulfurtransferase TusA family protein n=1 Tax=Streptosporangium sp. NPDC023615 TaxID=3154794 RepID=UPI0034419A82